MTHRTHKTYLRLFVVEESRSGGRGYQSRVVAPSEAAVLTPWQLEASSPRGHWPTSKPPWRAWWHRRLPWACLLSSSATAEGRDRDSRGCRAPESERNSEEPPLGFFSEEVHVL